jgi:hypothetical protein
MPAPNATPEASDSKAEQELVHQLHEFCRRVNMGATALQIFTVLIALSAIVLSLVVATYTGSTGEGSIPSTHLKLLAFLSAICTALFSGFRLRSKAADLRSAYRILKADLMRYSIGALTAADLIETYQKAEERIGQVEVDGLGDSKSKEPTA